MKIKFLSMFPLYLNLSDLTHKKGVTRNNWLLVVLTMWISLLNTSYNTGDNDINGHVLTDSCVWTKAPRIKWSTYHFNTSTGQRIYDIKLYLISPAYWPKQLYGICVAVMLITSSKPREYESTGAILRTVFCFIKTYVSQNVMHYHFTLAAQISLTLFYISWY